MSASLPVDVRHLAERGAQVQQSAAPVSVPLQVTAAHPLHVAESSTTVLGLPPPSQLHHVPSSPAISANIVPDAYDVSSSGSSTCGGTSYSGGGGPGSLGVALPAPPTRRTREFIPESKKDDEYWMKRQKNNQAAKRSREKRRANDAVMMRRIHELAAENKRLKLELDVLRRQLGLVPTTAESQPPLPSAVAASTLNAAAAEDQLVCRQKLELPPLTTRYDDGTHVIVVTTSSRSPGTVVMVDTVGAEQKQPPEETHLAHHYRHHLHHHHHAAYYTTDWPTTSSVSDAFSTSSSDAQTFASLPAYCRSTSGNYLPSIGNLCGSAPLQDNGGGCPRAWSSYRSVRDADQSPAPQQQPPPPSQTLVDSSPIVIFSDVSSSGDDSVDETLYGRHVDTLTMRQPVERVSDGGVAELPLNLSTPSRHQSPEFTRQACGTDNGGVLRRRSSVDFAHTAAPWLPSKDESGLASERRYGGDDVLVVGRGGYVCEPQLTRNGSLDDAQRHQSSRSTSLSSVASVAWQAGVDVAPPLSAVDELPLLAQTASTVDQRHDRSGLPLKVRRKYSSSTSRLIIDDTPRSAYDEQCESGGVMETRSRMWLQQHGRPTSLTRTPRSAQCSVSPEWFRPTTTAERARVAAVSDLEMLDQREERYE